MTMLWKANTRRLTMTKNELYKDWKESVKDQKKNHMVKSMLEIVENKKDNAYR